MTPITTKVHIQMQKHRQIQIHKRLRCSGMNIYQPSDFGSSTWGERHNSYNADCTIWPHKCAVHPVVLSVEICRTPWSDFNFSTPWSLIQLLNIMVGTPLLNCLQLRQTTPISVYMAQKSTFQWPSPQSTPNWHPFQNLQILSPSLLGMTSFTLQPHFLFRVYYDNCDCHILCVQAQNCTQYLCTWTKSRIVQSPTKLNDKI